jgi:hypothetical protein
MKTKLILGLSCILGLGLAACSGAGGDTDAAYTPPQPDAAITAPDTTPAPIDTAAPDPYIFVVIQDTEQVACNTNGPGTDVDAVALQDAAGNVLGYGKPGTAIYTANPLGDACTDCNNGKVCKYAANGGTFTVADLQARTEGPADATVSATADDTGYFSLNAGTLQIKIGSGVTGAGPVMELASGEFIYVYEVDKTYITSGSAYATCTCAPEHYTVRLQTAGGAYSKPLTPYAPATDNATLCAAAIAGPSDGCGSTTFVIP